MRIAALVATGLVAVVHVYFLVMEMFLWQTERVRRGFGLTAEFAADTAVLAANQGLYNGFLAAGLVVGVVASGSVGFAFSVFFLACVIVAGVYGWLTVSPRILLAQAVPGLVALALVLLARV